MPKTINDLKREIGYGARLNKYMVEVLYNGLDQVKIDVLCSNVDWPEIKMAPVSVKKRGRTYNMRSVKDFGGDQGITLTFYEDENFTIRRQFEAWMQVTDDNTRYYGTQKNGDNVSTLMSTSKKISLGNFFDTFKRTLSSGMTGQYDAAPYQCEVNIWALDHEGNKKFGYVLENAFCTGVKSESFNAQIQDQLQKTTIQISFSEIRPIKGTVLNNLSLKGLSF